MEPGGNNIQASNPNSEQPQISEANPCEIALARSRSRKNHGEENERAQQREEHLEAKDVFLRRKGYGECLVIYLARARFFVNCILRLGYNKKCLIYSLSKHAFTAVFLLAHKVGLWLPDVVRILLLEGEAYPLAYAEVFAKARYAMQSSRRGHTQPFHHSLPKQLKQQPCLVHTHRHLHDAVRKKRRGRGGHSSSSSTSACFRR